MLKTLSDFITEEDRILAPYATHVSKTRGRRFPEPEHPFRTDFQRDRDRILHSHAFRRLEYKTQVFLSGSGDHLRNRLTHTIEVAGIARTMARTLGLNEDLTETIALAHDLGHTPFGHAGERALHLLMEDCGGFDHNLQALRIVDELEVKYPAYDGINLTWETRTGLIKHRKKGITKLDGELLLPLASLETQIADLADDLTYYGHDVDDGLDAGILKEDMLEELEIWRMAEEETRHFQVERNDERFSAYTIRALINMMVGDAVHTSADLIAQANPGSPDDVGRGSHPLIAFSPAFQKMTHELKLFLYSNLYFSPELSKLNSLSLSRMELLFNKFLDDPAKMGETAQQRIAKDGLHRAVADYIAGMTDTFAVAEYMRLKD